MQEQSEIIVQINFVFAILQFIVFVLYANFNARTHQTLKAKRKKLKRQSKNHAAINSFISKKEKALKRVKLQIWFYYLIIFAVHLYVIYSALNKEKLNLLIPSLIFVFVVLFTLLINWLRGEGMGVPDGKKPRSMSEF